MTARRPTRDRSCSSRSAASPRRPTPCWRWAWAPRPSASSSPRRPARWRPAAVADIVKRLPHETVTVGVFRDESPRRVVEIAGQIGLRAVQLHGFESAEDTRWVAERVAVDHQGLPGRPPQHRAVRRVRRPTLLVDGPNPGSGELFDWRLAEGVVDPSRLLVSGGLRPDNVGAAVAHLHPWGVDVATGVESSPGREGPRPRARLHRGRPGGRDAGWRPSTRDRVDRRRRRPSRTPTPPTSSTGRTTADRPRPPARAVHPGPGGPHHTPPMNDSERQTMTTETTTPATHHGRPRPHRPLRRLRRALRARGARARPASSSRRPSATPGPTRPSAPSSTASSRDYGGPAHAGHRVRPAVRAARGPGAAEARGPGPHRVAQAQQRRRPGPAGPADGQAQADRRDRRRPARGGHGHRGRTVRHGVHRLHGRGRHRSARSSTSSGWSCSGADGGAGHQREPHAEGRRQRGHARLGGLGGRHPLLPGLGHGPPPVSRGWCGSSSGSSATRPGSSAGSCSTAPTPTWWWPAPAGAPTPRGSSPASPTPRRRSWWPSRPPAARRSPRGSPASSTACAAP